ncbi:MAG TPA: hypothetical protein VMW24_14270 [Sedimentisphaerales bacterium]|nr:hypothetical protein [Sedimentisphaerales bacterium]
MTLKSIAIALVVLSGAVAATEAAAQTCQTITHTRYVKRCGPYGTAPSAGYAHCHVSPVTTTQRICVANPPTIRRTPSLPRRGLTIRRRRS